MTAAISAGAAALIGAGGALAGGAIASSGAKKAAGKAVAGQQAGIDETGRQYDQTRADFAPYRQIGTGALNQLAQLYGIPSYQPEPVQAALPAPAGNPALGNPIVSAIDRHTGRGRSSYLPGNARVFDNTGTGATVPGVNSPGIATAQGASPAATGAPDYSAFYNSPDYQFALQQGEQAVLRNRSATGNLASGNALLELQRTGQGLASQQYGNYTNRLAQLAGIGQSATSQLGQFGSNASGNIANLFAGQGNARASGIADQTNAWGGAINQLGTIAGDYFSNRRPKQPVKVGIGG